MFPIVFTAHYSQQDQEIQYRKVWVMTDDLYNQHSQTETCVLSLRITPVIQHANDFCNNVMRKHFSLDISDNCCESCVCVWVWVCEPSVYNDLQHYDDDDFCYVRLSCLTWMQTSLHCWYIKDLSKEALYIKMGHKSGGKNRLREKNKVHGMIRAWEHAKRETSLLFHVHTCKD